MFEFNGKNIKLVMDYNFMCELEDMGISITDLEKYPLKTIRSILFLTFKREDKNITIEKIGDEIMTYIANGGSLETVGVALNSALEESAFFPKNNK